MVSGAEGLGAAADRIEAVLCHLLIPLFLRTATNPKGCNNYILCICFCYKFLHVLEISYEHNFRILAAISDHNPAHFETFISEASVIQAKDLSFCLSLMQNAISPPIGKHSTAPIASSTNLATTFIRGGQHSMSIKREHRNSES